MLVLFTVAFQRLIQLNTSNAGHRLDCQHSLNYELNESHYGQKVPASAKFIKANVFNVLRYFSCYATV